MSLQVIAEAGVNHNGSLEMALALVDLAADAGADVVKFQTFRADALASAGAPKADYQKRSTGADETQFDMLKRLELDEEAHAVVQKHCIKRGIEFLSSPFDPDSLDFLVRKLAVKRLKLGSGEVTNAPLLVAAGNSGLPVILSTGMSSLADVEQALAALAAGYLKKDRLTRSMFNHLLQRDEAWEELRKNVTLLHCTSQYPAPPEQANLRALDTLQRAFGLPVGYSDHTEGTLTAIAAVARGATVIEKHFTLDKALPGPDHRASLGPDEIRDFVSFVRMAERTLGDGVKQVQPAEASTVDAARRSLVAERDMRAGEVFDETSISVKRPGGGRSPFDYWDILGTASPTAMRRGDLLK